MSDDAFCKKRAKIRWILHHLGAEAGLGARHRLLVEVVLSELAPKNANELRFETALETESKT